jgi:hypothetical protein
MYLCVCSEFHMLSVRTVYLRVLYRCVCPVRFVQPVVWCEEPSNLIVIVCDTTGGVPDPNVPALRIPVKIWLPMGMLLSTYPTSVTCYLPD